MANPSPRVSVICIFLDEERFLAEAIESVLAQTFMDLELILVDDGSQDQSSDIARRYAERHPGKMTILEHPGRVNRGMSASRNLGLVRAQGEFISFIDGDDRWPVSKLSEQLMLMDAEPRASVVCGAVNYWRSWDGEDDSIRPTGHVRDRLSFPPTTALALYPLGTAPAVAIGEALIRREVFNRVGGFEDQFADLYEDQVFLSKVYMTSPVYFSTKVFLDYRQHDDNSVFQARKQGLYRIKRQRFLDWLEGWINANEPSGKGRLLRALRREQWKLRHVFLGKVFARLQNLLSRA